MSGGRRQSRRLQPCSQHDVHARATLERITRGARIGALAPVLADTSAATIKGYHRTILNFALADCLVEHLLGPVSVRDSSPRHGEHVRVFDQKLIARPDPHSTDRLHARRTTLHGKLLPRDDVRESYEYAVVRLSI